MTLDTTSARLQGRHDADRQDEDDGLQRSRRRRGEVAVDRFSSESGRITAIVYFAVMRLARSLPRPLSLRSSAASGGGTRSRPRPSTRAARQPPLAQHRPGQHRRTHRRLRRRARARPARRDLRRDRERRRVQEHEPGHVVDADLRSRRRDDVDRRHRRRAVEPEHRLGRHRRSEQPAELVVGRRRLQVDRRRPAPGRRPASPTRATSAASSFTRRTRTSSTSRRPATCGDRTAERGVFKTTDGGQTWTKVLYVDDNTGATDLVMDPQDPQTLFAAMYQRQRKAWGFNGGGPGSGIYRSRDGGATWTRLSNGLPAGRQGAHRPRHLPRRSARRSSPSSRRPAARAASTAAPTAATPGRRGRRSTRGRCTSARSAPIRRTRRASTCSDRIAASTSPTTAARRSRTSFSTIHSEDHALWIDPDDTNHLIVGGDGGVSISWDRGQTWLFRDNLPVGQFYEISADMQDPVRRSAAACRTTATGACRARRATAPASRTATASTSAAATASTRGSIRPTRARRSSSRRTAAPTA